MWVPAVGPEEEEPVEQRLDVGNVGFPIWKDPEDSSVLLMNNNTNRGWFIHFTYRCTTQVYLLVSS